MPQIDRTLSATPKIPPYTNHHPDKIRFENLQRFVATLRARQKILITENLASSLGYSNYKRMLRHLRDRGYGIVANDYFTKI